MSLVNISSTTLKRHQPSREEWLDLKPTIRQLYIQEDKTLPQVVKLLRERHGFVLTKKQLTWKLKKWNFRKNTRAAEREPLARNGVPSSDESFRAMMSIRITNPKIERWKWSLGMDAIGNFGSGSSNAISSHPYNEPASPARLSEFQAEQAPNSGETFYIEDALLQRPIEWPLPSGTVEPGPVFLSRLFSILSITDAPDVLSSTKLLATSKPTESTESQYLSLSQYTDLTWANNTDPLSVLRQQQQRQPGSHLLNIAACRSNSTSPYNEVCLFSSFESDNRASKPGQTVRRLTQMAIDQHQILELETRLSKLQGLLPETHPAILAILRGLYNSYCSIGKWSVAELWCRRIIAISRNEKIESPQTLLDSLDLIYTFTRQGRIKEAVDLFDQLQPGIRRNRSFESVLTGESLAARSLTIQSFLQRSMGFFEHAAGISHQLIQLRISSLGPYVGESLEAMLETSCCLAGHGSWSESVRILYLLLQLQERCKDICQFTRLEAMRQLVRSLRQQNHHKESVAIARQSVELAEKFLGCKHITTLRNSRQLARSLHHAELLSESEAVLRDVLAKIVSFYGENDLITINTMHELGPFLVEANNCEEGTTLLEIAFRRSLEVRGWTDHVVLGICTSLRNCYERQGRLTESSALYEQAVQEVQIRAGPWRKHYYFQSVHRLAECYLYEGRHNECIDTCKRALQEITDEKSEAYRYEERWISATLADCYKSRGQYHEAAVLFEQCVLKIRRTEKWNHKRCIRYSFHLGLCYENMGRHSDALALYQRSIRNLQEMNGYDSEVAQIQQLIDETVARNPGAQCTSVVGQNPSLEIGQ